MDPDPEAQNIRSGSATLGKRYLILEQLDLLKSEDPSIIKQK
jgi:hypothetical protein